MLKWMPISRGTPVQILVMLAQNGIRKPIIMIGSYCFFLSDLDLSVGKIVCAVFFPGTKMFQNLSYKQI